YIYWGGPDRGYHASHRTALPGESVLSVFIADFNRDGFKEVLLFNHSKDFDHSYGSWIYRGSEDGFSQDRRSRLPTFGVHVSRGVDIGNIRDRSFEESYVSAPIPLDA